MSKTCPDNICALCYHDKSEASNCTRPDCECSRAPTCSKGEPLRQAYSRAEITDLMTDWMLCIYGSPSQLSEAERNAWFERNGMMAHFLRDQFPENTQDQEREASTGSRR